MDLSTPLPSATTPYDVVVLLSGGLDSAILLAYLCQECEATPLALHFYQRMLEHELVAARSIATAFNVDLKVIDITSFLAACVSFTEGHHLEFGAAAFFTMALTFAIEHKIPAVAVGLNRLDAETYPENTPAFLDCISSGLRLISSNCRLIAPFHSWTKAEVLRKGAQLGVPLEKTMSCVTPIEDIHDGTCCGCQDRIAAFEAAGIDDPTPYATSGVSLRPNWSLGPYLG